MSDRGTRAAAHCPSNSWWCQPLAGPQAAYPSAGNHAVACPNWTPQPAAACKGTAAGIKAPTCTQWGFCPGAAAAAAVLAGVPVSTEASC